jgi:hypothetical protein
MPSEPPIPVELWEQVPPGAQAALLAVLARSEQRLAEQHAPSDDLRQRLNTNSTNSCKPPSSDGPQVKRPPAKLSQRQAEQLLQDFYSVPLCAAQVCSVEGSLGEVLDPVVAEVAAELRRGPANVDETGWREDRRKAWLWVAVSGYLAVYPIVATRSAEQVKRLLGERYAGILGSDRWSAYAWVPPQRRQVCWAHLRRDFQAMIDREDRGSARTC